MKWLSLWNPLLWMEISHLLIKKTCRKLVNYNHLYEATIFLQWHSQIHCLINPQIIPRIKKWKPFKKCALVAKATSQRFKKNHTHAHTFVCLFVFIYLNLSRMLLPERCCFVFRGHLWKSKKVSKYHYRCFSKFNDIKKMWTSIFD